MEESLGMIKLTLLLTSLLLSNTANSDYLNCPCKVVKVVDGDTVYALDQGRERHKIRLGGIDAPEHNQAFGNKSTDNLARLIAGKNILVEYVKRDKYGRIIGKLLKGNLDINLQQVKDGFAWHYKHFKRDQSVNDRVLYSSAEIEAKNKRIGLWSSPATPPWEFGRKRK